jgi:hypothetical protein
MSSIRRAVDVPNSNTYTWIKKISKRRREPLCKSSTPGILCVYPVLLSSPVFMPRNLKFPAPTLTKNGCGCEKGITILSTRNDKP